MRVLSVVARVRVPQTPYMERANRPTAFVTRAAGFVGSELVKVLAADGHHVVGLAPSPDAAQQVKRAGGTPVMGDLLRPGSWQDEAAADWVFHLPPHPYRRGRVTRKRVEAIARARMSMDTHLLDAVAGGPTRHIVYVADANWYGSTGMRSITEDEPPRPSAWRHCQTPILERVEGYGLAGLPIVTGLLGWVYGNASWFRDRVIEPIMDGRRVTQFGTWGPWISTIHVHDCARALVHLARHGETGGRYFVVNSEPVLVHEFAETFARLARRPLRVRRIPAAGARLVVGSVLADYLRKDAVFSNIRLRGIGFRFRYPTLERGLQQIVRALHEQRNLSRDPEGKAIVM